MRDCTISKFQPIHTLPLYNCQNLFHSELATKKCACFLLLVERLSTELLKNYFDGIGKQLEALLPRFPRLKSASRPYAYGASIPHWKRLKPKWDSNLLRMGHQSRGWGCSRAEVEAVEAADNMTTYSKWEPLHIFNFAWNHYLTFLLWSRQKFQTYKADVEGLRPLRLLRLQTTWESLLTYFQFWLSCFGPRQNLHFPGK